MFNKEKFSKIIKSINDSYDTQHEFARISTINRTYLSKYINCKIDNPPKPSTLKILAESSHGITTYEELMYICGYANKPFGYGIVNTNIIELTLFVSLNGKLEPYNNLWIDKSLLKSNHQYFAYKANDDTMLPLLGNDDIAIIEKTNTYKNGNTCLISLDNKLILIRKIIEFNDYIELHTAFPYSQPIKITNEEKEKRNFKVLGKVIRAENQSAFN